MLLPYTAAPVNVVLRDWMYRRVMQVLLAQSAVKDARSAIGRVSPR